MPRRKKSPDDAALPKHVRRPKRPTLTVAFRIEAEDAKILAVIAEELGQPGDLHGTARFLLQKYLQGQALARFAQVSAGDKLTPEQRSKARDALLMLASAFGVAPAPTTPDLAKAVDAPKDDSAKKGVA